MARKLKKKYSIDEIQRLTDEEFQQLLPVERLRINVILQKQIWGERYNSQSLKGLKVTKVSAADLK